MARKGLGEILREADLISEAQLAEALALQKSYGERLASILVRKHILTEKFAVTYLGRQVGVPGVDLSQQEIDLALLSKVTLEICEKNLVFPVKVRFQTSDGTATVADRRPGSRGALGTEVHRADEAGQRRPLAGDAWARSSARRRSPGR